VGRPRQRTPELRSRFIAETIKLLETCGLDRVTTRLVATASDSSQAALHELFGGKPGLMSAAALTGFSDLHDELHHAAASAEPDSPLLAICRAHREFSDQHPELISLMYSRPHSTFAPSKRDLVVASNIVHVFTAEVARLIGAERSSEQVVDTSLGLIALLVGLHNQERSGTLGSTAPTVERRWVGAINRYLS